MSEIRELTIEELAEDAFLKQECVNSLMMTNTPMDPEKRKRAFIELCVARKAAEDARRALESKIRGPKP